MSTQNELKRVLGLRSLVFYGVAFMIPLAFFTTYGITTGATHGHVSLTYVIATACMVFTAYGYCRMSKAYPSAGSVYTYASETMNSNIGFIAGWTILIGYAFLPMLNYLASAIFVVQVIPGVPQWVWIVIFTVFVTGANLLGIKVADLFNNVVVILQLIFLVVLAIMTIRYISGNGLDLFAGEHFFNPVALAEAGGFSALMAGAAIVCLAYLGFDGIATMSEEAINPTKTVPRAIMISCVGMGCLFIVFTYLFQAAWPTAYAELTDLDGAAVPMIVRVAGNVMGYLFVAGYVIGCIAASISAVASASRVMYGMGRDNLLPKAVFGKVNTKGVPVNNVIIMGLFGLTALFFSLTVASCLINFGALLGFAFVNVSVIMHYFVKNKERTTGDFFRHLIVPVIGAVYCLYMLINLSGTSIIYGIIWTVIGVIWLAYVTKGFKKEVKIQDI